jgi:hypothetical protein
MWCGTDGRNLSKPSQQEMIDHVGIFVRAYQRTIHGLQCGRRRQSCILLHLTFLELDLIRLVRHWIDLTCGVDTGFFFVHHTNIGGDKMLVSYLPFSRATTAQLQAHQQARQQTLQREQQQARSSSPMQTLLAIANSSLAQCYHDSPLPRRRRDSSCLYLWFSSYCCQPLYYDLSTRRSHQCQCFFSGLWSQRSAQFVQSFSRHQLFSGCHY